MALKNNPMAKLSPRGKQISVIALAVAALAGVLYLSIGGSQGERETRWNRKTDTQVNVITDKSNKNMGIDAISGRLKYLDQENRLLSQKVERLEKERAAEKADSSSERVWREKFAALSTEIDALRAQQRDMATNKNSAAEMRTAAPVTPGTKTVDDPFEVRQRQQEDAPSDQPKGTNRKPRKGSLKISVVSETEEVDKEVKPVAQKKETTRAAYIPAGSILTGTLINGADFPTGKGSFENPTPTLIRLSKHAILPNRFTSDVRECFLLVSGHGELASERAKLRGETLSCVREDGGVIQTKLNSYVAGEDGKEGIKGRLVSKQGQLIARTMVAGFLSGMAGAFDYEPVSVLSTTATNQVQYQKNFSTEAAKGGIAKGAQNALDRVAQFYMDLADQMVPVVEINAGRQVDIIVTAGTTLNVTAQNQVSQHAAAMKNGGK